MTLNSMHYIHNLHLNLRGKLDQFDEVDSHLKKLASLPYQFESPLLKTFLNLTPGVYSVTGGRQIGKTTFLKQWVKELLQKKCVRPESIFFLSGEIIFDHKELISIMHDLVQNIMGLPELSATNFVYRYIIIDEITYIREWDKAVKFLVDAGVLLDVVLVLTGSDSMLIQEARMGFPGRRGEEDVADFIYNSLSFKEVVDLKRTQEIKNFSHEDWLKFFDDYLIHGGYLTAINNMALHQKILPSTLQTYSDWIRGDFLKQGKQESFLKEIIQTLIKHLGSQITWNSLTKGLSIDHPATVISYVNLLERCGIAFVLDALREDHLTAAPKKAKKIYFSDPFIYHALSLWVSGPAQPDESQLPALIEGLVIAHYRRLYPDHVFYIKAEGEVDLAYVKNQNFFPVEIKWTGQIHPKDLKQISKYPQGMILHKNENQLTLQVPRYFLPQYLYRLIS